MDKEMMAKVNEVLKTHGKRELSMDEMEQVVGGSTKFSTYKRGGGYYIRSEALGDVEMTLHEFGELLWGIYNNFSPDVALIWLNEVAPNPHNEELIRVFQPWGVVDHYMRRLDGGESFNPYWI